MSNNSEKKVLLSVKNLKKYFPVAKRKLFQKEQYYVHANESITLDIYEGETLGLVGESGCGKSTFGRTLIQIYEQTEGTTLYYGETMAAMAPAYVKKVIKKIPQLVSAYQVAAKERDEMVAAHAKMEAGLDKDSLAEKIMFKNREIENKYLNMARIAGGLLCSDDLNAVSAELLEVYELQVVVAKNSKRIHRLQTKLADAEQAAKMDVEKAKAEIEQLSAENTKQEAVIAEKQAALEEKRAALKDRPLFEVYEECRDEGVDLSQLTEEEMRVLRKDMQFIFQDPYSSLDTKMTVGQIVGEGVLGHKIFKSSHGEAYNEYIQGVMKQCGLDPYFIHRYPHQFSGGQRQRIGIARALALKPKFIVCDESVSALDVSIQSQVINLLQDLKEEHKLTYLFITHDLSVVKYISDRIGVMYLGHIVELSETENIFDDPQHPYTQALLAAIPRTDVEDQELSILEGDIPSTVHPPSGCKFHTRCPIANETCKKFEPALKEYKPGHFVACHMVKAADEE
ncbi:MAG: ATP-binding cassette domain-containing protein [Eubacteriales bacterium]|nr:ATP-binding cassette domain-containing protein [Eubacteriales bacterium]